MVNAQEWLDNNYPKENRKEIKNLDISNKDLEGGLDLTDFVNLEELKCSDNKLFDLELSKCNKLTRLMAYRNLFISIDFLTKLPNPEKLSFLDLGSCNFFPQKLDFLTVFTNLRKLYINGYDEGRTKQGIYNRFYGSLKPLKSLCNLEIIDFGNTDIDSGLEYLPDSLNSIRKIGEYKRENAKSWEIYRQLDPYFNEAKKQFEFARWRQNNPCYRLKEEIEELSNVIFPNQPYNFNQLKQEISRLKYQELALQVRKEKAEFEQLITNAKTKLAVDLKPILDLYRQTLAEESNSLKEGKLTAYQEILEGSLAKEELQTLLNKQTQLHQLERHLTSLQQNQEQTTQILHTPLKK